MDTTASSWPLLLVFTLMLADFFDTMGTMTAIGAEADLLDEEGMPPNTQRILIVDSLAAWPAVPVGLRQHVVHRVGLGRRRRRPHRPGLVVTGPAVPARDVLRAGRPAIPPEAAVPALVLVGFLMMQQVKGIDWDDLEIAIPAFLTIVLMPFTYSITAGIGAGFLAFVLIKLVRGKVERRPPLMWIIGARSSSTSRSTRSPTGSPERLDQPLTRRQLGDGSAVMSAARRNFT